ncbi:MAG: hypothetical protein LBG43_11095, partial [Treponema sp.]|nr:hypothetical protein [Treponema sp.]
MCKKFSAVCCALVIVTAVYSLDFDKAKTALNGGSFIPVLVDYGFTEQQINSWTVGKIYIPFYLQQIRSGTLTAEAATTMLKNTSGAIGEISINDMIKMEQFFKDMATAADQLRNEENAERTAAEKSRTEAYQRYEQEKRQAEEAARIREAEEAEIERQEYAKRQEQRRQEAERNQRSKEQYAKSLGCLDYIDEGLIVTQAQITSANFDLAKKALIIPESNDLNYTVSNIVGNYVIYTAVISFAAISCNELFISFSKKQFILSEVALSYNSLLIGRDS